MNLEKIKEKSKAILMYLLRITIMIGSIVLIIIAMRWFGIKGILGMIFGMFVSTYLILSKNVILRALIEMMHSEEYVDELRGKGK